MYACTLRTWNQTPWVSLYKGTYMYNGWHVLWYTTGQYSATQPQRHIYRDWGLRGIGGIGDAGLGVVIYYYSSPGVGYTTPGSQPACQSPVLGGGGIPSLVLGSSSHNTPGMSELGFALISTHFHYTCTSYMYMAKCWMWAPVRPLHINIPIFIYLFDCCIPVYTSTSNLCYQL